MSKKKKIKERIANMDPVFDHELNLKIADVMEEIVYNLDNYVIVEGRSKELVDDSLDKMRKGIKDIRNGKPEKVFDEERYRLWREYCNNGSD